jgi:hypothetical protein
MDLIAGLQRTFEDCVNELSATWSWGDYIEGFAELINLFIPFFFLNKCSLFIYWAYYNSGYMNPNQCYVIGTHCLVKC